MDQADFSGFFKTIIFLVFFYYLSKFLIRFFGPFLFKTVVRKMQEKASGKQTFDDVKEGETVVDKRPPSKNKSLNDVGDYIDYEEV